MNRASALAIWNRKVLLEYSRRTTEALRTSMPLRLALPRLELFLDLNVAKEARKDALIIGHAAMALLSETPPGDETRRQIFETTKEIDRDFLARVAGLPVGIVIRYEAIAPIRMQRIECLLAASRHILYAWRQTRSGRAALQSAYSLDEFEALIRELLHLYALETQVLSRSLRLPKLLVPLRELLAQNVYRIMNNTAGQLSSELSGIVYRAGRK